MKSINVVEQNYQINIGTNLDNILKEKLKHYKNCKVMIVTDTNVLNFYQTKLAEIMAEFEYDIFAIEPGEQSKSFVMYKAILEKLSEQNFSRQDLIIAFGGGVPGDLAGFVASSYLRGISFVSIPTTLLSMVDSSVGGKNGINLKDIKNQVGSFYFPDYVHIDIEFLKTLPIKQIHNGLAEVFKYAILADKELFEMLEKPIENFDWIAIIARCLNIKIDYVCNDVKDHGKRQFLNLGHTLGHAIEVLSNYKISHGEAVGVGMIYMARAAKQLNYTDIDIAHNLEKIFNKHNMITKYPLEFNETIKILLHDKKIRGNKISLIIPINIGNVIRKTVAIEEIKTWIEASQL